MAKAPKTGRRAAMKYFTGQKKKSPKAKQNKNHRTSPPFNQSLLAFSVGALWDQKFSHRFESQLWNSEIFYQSHGGSYAACGLHLEWQERKEKGERLNQFSFLISFSVPRSITFPVYMGLAAGPGLFSEKRDKKTNWTLDSRLYLGLRLTGVHSQYFLQTGVKNYFQNFKKTEFQGLFTSVGLAYRF